MIHEPERSWLSVATSTISMWLVYNLWYRYLGPYLQVATLKDRIHHISLIIALTITLSASILSFNTASTPAMAQSRYGNTGSNVSPSMERDTLENRFAIESLKESNSTLKDIIERMEREHKAEMKEMREDLEKTKRESASQTGALRMLASLIFVILAGLQVMQIVTLRKKV